MKYIFSAILAPINCYQLHEIFNMRKTIVLEIGIWTCLGVRNEYTMHINASSSEQQPHIAHSLCAGANNWPKTNCGALSFRIFILAKRIGKKKIFDTHRKFAIYFHWNFFFIFNRIKNKTKISFFSHLQFGTHLKIKFICRILYSIVFMRLLVFPFCSFSAMRILNATHCTHANFKSRSWQELNDEHE